MTMLKKKNYKDEDHFTQLHTFMAIAPPTNEQHAKKYQVYFKRYRPAITANQNIYNLATSKAPTQPSQPTDYPVDRTLELISFDGSLSFLKKYLRKIGKIRKF